MAQSKPLREIRPAKGIMEYLAIRKIRNDNRFFMTAVHNRISLFHQLMFCWFMPKDFSLYVCTEYGKVVGYMLLRKEQNTCLITEAVDRRYRGKGIASDMIQFAQLLCKRLAADILNTNIASINLHEKMGFKLKIYTSYKKTYVWESPL